MGDDGHDDVNDDKSMTMKTMKLTRKMTMTLTMMTTMKMTMTRSMIIIIIMNECHNWIVVVLLFCSRRSVIRSHGQTTTIIGAVLGTIAVLIIVGLVAVIVRLRYVQPGDIFGELRYDKIT